MSGRKQPPVQCGQGGVGGSNRQKIQESFLGHLAGPDNMHEEEDVDTMGDTDRITENMREARRLARCLMRRRDR
jgi:hypothetical protein